MTLLGAKNVVWMGGLSAAQIGGWIEAGRFTAGVTTDDLDVTGLANDRYYMILGDVSGTASINAHLGLNGDKTDTYAERFSDNGGADLSFIDIDRMMLLDSGFSDPLFAVGYLANLSAQTKLGMSWNVQQRAINSTPIRRENVGKYVETTNPIDEINFFNTAGAGDFNIGSELVVLEWSPDDIHTNNFWEQLGTDINSDPSFSFTSKKYLWIQGMNKASAASTEFGLRVGNTTLDTGTNYIERSSDDGGADSTESGLTFIDTTIAPLASGSTQFYNIFIKNVAAQQGIGIIHITENGTTGVGITPNRREMVFKWKNTADQMDIIQMLATAGSSDSESFIKMWGAD